MTLGTDRDSDAERADAHQREQRPIIVDNHRISRGGDSNSRRRCQEGRLFTLMPVNLLSCYWWFSPRGWSRPPFLLSAPISLALRIRSANRSLDAWSSYPCSS